MEKSTETRDGARAPGVRRGPAIPNLFHFVFGLQKQEQPFHLVHYLCLESCLRVNQPDQVFFHHHHEPYGRYWDLIKHRITPVKVDPEPFVAGYAYRDKDVGHYRYAHQSDFIRLDKLIEHGGIYADIDTIFVHPLPERLFTRPFVLGREDDVACPDTGRVRRSLCNAFIMSRPGAEFAVRWRERMEESFNGSWSNHSTFLPQELSERHPGWIHVEPSRTFYKHMWTREGIRTLLEGCDPDFTGVCSLHLWAHLWWSRRRRDFSSFHVGKLTETFIRRVDTTYNLVARRFLP